MAVSTFFNQYNYTNEQQLLDQLVVESIRIYGMDMYYIPRTRNNFDSLYYEDSISSFDLAIPIEVYMKSISGFEGPQSFMSKFGLEIRDQFVFSIARSTFANIVSQYNSEIIRPREGDLLYFTMNRKCFEIKYVDNKPFFYQLGELQLYDCTTELFEYSNEKFNTGIPDIDSIQSNLSTNIYDYGLKADDGSPLKTDNDDYLVVDQYDKIISQNDPLRNNASIQNENVVKDIIDYSEKNPFSEDP